MIVLGGKLRTRFSVSRMRDVVVWSRAVRFHSDKISSCKIHPQGMIWGCLLDSLPATRT